MNVHTKYSVSCSSSCTKLQPACGTNTAERTDAELPAQPCAITLGEGKPHRFYVKLFSSQHSSVISRIFLDPSREDKAIFSPVPSPSSDCNNSALSSLGALICINHINQHMQNCKRGVNAVRKVIPSESQESMCSLSSSRAGPGAAGGL